MARRHYPPVPPGTHSSDYFEPNRGTHLRHPKHPRIVIPQTRSELTGPTFPYTWIRPSEPAASADRQPVASVGADLQVGPPVDADLTKQHAGEPIGERIVLHGRVLDEDGRPVPQTIVEIWQANAAGRYAHGVDNHDAPLDPNFSGTGRAITDADGRYRFLTIMPGRYPFQNHYNAWRPAHVHFSLLGPNFLTRLVTQMFFPGDPLHAFDPIFHGVPEHARDRVVASFDIDATVPDWSLAFCFDLVLRGRQATPFGI